MYSEIVFDPGDSIRLTASGAVYISDRRLVWPFERDRWLDYANPCEYLHQQADRLYHGLIWIPGATVWHGGKLAAVPVGTDLVPIGSVLSDNFTVKKPTDARRADSFKACRPRAPWNHTAALGAADFVLSGD